MDFDRIRWYSREYETGQIQGQDLQGHQTAIVCAQIKLTTNRFIVQ